MTPRHVEAHSSEGVPQSVSPTSSPGVANAGATDMISGVRSVGTTRLLSGLLVGAAVISACSNDDPAGDAGRFCGEIEANQAQLVAPELVTSADVEPLLDLYRDIGELAPLAIEPEWDQLVLNYETASTVVPEDENSVQRAVEMALQSEQAGARVKQWLVENCALDIGPVATLAPHS